MGLSASAELLVADGYHVR